MKKTTCTPFVNTLNIIHEKGITSKAALTADPTLYADFWFAVKGFCHFALLSKTGGKKSDGEILLGNIGKIDALVNRGVTTRDDIETDCLIKILDKSIWCCASPSRSRKLLLRHLQQPGQRLFQETAPRRYEARFTQQHHRGRKN